MVPNVRASPPPLGHGVNLGCHEMINVVEKENKVLHGVELCRPSF